MIFYPILVIANQVNLLTLPIDNESNFLISVENVKKCTFKGVKDLEISNLKLSNKENWFLSNINFLQEKINLKLETRSISDDQITFSLSSAKNLIFKFFYKKNFFI